MLADAPNISVEAIHLVGGKQRFVGFINDRRAYLFRFVVAERLIHRKPVDFGKVLAYSGT